MRKNPSPQKIRPHRSFWLWLLAFAIIVSSLFEIAQAENGVGAPDRPGQPQVHLQAASGLAIDFQSQNGETFQEQPPQAKDIPHLVLFRNGQLAPAAERTLRLELTGLEVPPAGLSLHLKVETQHGDPDRDGEAQNRITVWEHRQCLPQEKEGQTAGLALEQVFGETVAVQGQPVRTPSDYYRLELAVYPGAAAAGEPVFTYAEEHAFLLESQWAAPLVGLAEETPGAAPEELVLYYGDMFPFQGDPYDPETRLPREQVHAYVQEELGPALVAAVEQQTNTWGFAWHAGWTGFREGADRERLSVALAPGRVWYHGKAPAHAHGGVSINLDYKNRGAYERLTDWLVSVFNHELFHNLQRDQSLAQGRAGDVDGKQEAWEFLAEGTAVVASSASHPEVEFAGSGKARTYPSRANRFLAGTEFFESGLQTSYSEIDPYATALYWRFLYEQCSGAQGAQGDLESGMQVIRQTLSTLYAEDDLAGIAPEQRVAALPELMDRVFAKAAWCPFRTYRESLEAFARAIYALRLEGGRCERAMGLAGCGFYDPNGLYAQPPVEEVGYRGSETAYEGGIGSSYGMAFAEVVLEPEAQGGSLAVAFEPAEGGLAEFSVQVWKLVRGENGGLAPVASQANGPDDLVSVGEGGGGVFRVERVERESYERLGLVITRLDSRESEDPAGAFTLSLRPVESGVRGAGD